ncbi:MAG: DUF427 domain-containing protein [Gemmataceae bacterium]
MKPKRIEPGPGQESVWDYPRPPRIEPTEKRIRVYFNGELIAETTRAIRFLETSHPPTYYIPPEDFKQEYLSANPRSSYCEWKGRAFYYDLDVNGKKIEGAGWYYPDPVAEYAILKDHIAIYPSLMDSCYVDDEKVQPQAGDFYGGWITSDIVGPFKGEPGTMFW